MRAPSVMAGLVDAQMALAISQLNRQAATAFWNAGLDVSRITLASLAQRLLSKGKSAKNERADKYRRQP
jgi:hypothetical protein